MDWTSVYINSNVTSLFKSKLNTKLEIPVGCPGFHQNRSIPANSEFAKKLQVLVPAKIVQSLSPPAENPYLGHLLDYILCTKQFITTISLSQVFGALTDSHLPRNISEHVGNINCNMNHFISQQYGGCIQAINLS